MQFRLYIAVILAGTINFVSAQNNLVINPSLEDTVSCPTFLGQINKAVGWHILISGGGGNPELYHTCCSLGCGVPYNLNNLGYQYPKTGIAYAGLDVANYNGVLREYIQSKLIDKLKNGDTYCVKFFTNLSNYSFAYIKSLGVYLDDGEILTTTTLGLPYANAALQPVIPQIINTFQPLSDTLNWMKIEGSFVATGLEEYITIGNFFPDSTSDIVLIGTPSYWTSYYYIDDVSVIDMSLPAYAGNDTLIQPGDSVFIGRQPEIGLDEDCIWFVNGVPIDTVAGLWVQPDSTTTYVLEQTICGNVSWDTVRVSVYGTGIEGATHGLTRGFRVYPNPASNVLTIESPVTNATLSISNLLGQEVLRQPINDKVSQIDISKLGKGVYFVRVESAQGVVVRRFLKE